ncbi:tripartite tricarboxylate transporter substrate binding protein [Acetobacteraceae bacterium H6797]|nr:tripartite tricarboxylate transporter substrate binding protein [Acetobacteraceae bacterium H6797]
MTHSRRTLLATVAAGLAMPAIARAATWAPNRTIRMIVPYAAGGGADTTARLLTNPLSAALGQTVVVENRGGAGGSIGAGEVARSAPDGHTVMLDALGFVATPSLLKVPFDYNTSFTPISQLTVLPQMMIVPAKSPYNTLPEFLAAAKDHKSGLVAYGSSGNASAAHLAAVELLRRANVELEHVPYRGGGPALQDLLAGNLAFVFGTVSSSTQLVRDGQVKALGITTAKRIPALPNLPTIAEQGFPGYELNEWNGFYGPAGMAPEVVDAWYKALQTALKDETVKARLEAMGAIGMGTPPAEFATFLAAQRKAMGDLIREAGITAG